MEAENDRQEADSCRGRCGRLGWEVEHRCWPAFSRRASELLIGVDTRENDREKWVVRR